MLQRRQDAVAIHQTWYFDTAAGRQVGDDVIGVVVVRRGVGVGAHRLGEDVDQFAGDVPGGRWALLVGTPAAGQITVADEPRRLQFALKYTF